MTSPDMHAYACLSLSPPVTTVVTVSLCRANLSRLLFRSNNTIFLRLYSQRAFPDSPCLFFHLSMSKLPTFSTTILSSLLHATFYTQLLDAGRSATKSAVRFLDLNV